MSCSTATTSTSGTRWARRGREPAARVYVFPGLVAYEAIFAKETNVTPFPGFVLYNNTGNNVLEAVLVGAGGQIDLKTPSASLGVSAWHHVAMTYDGSSTAAGTKM